MTPFDLVPEFLKQLQIQYCVIGGRAYSAILGTDASKKDWDVLIHMNDSSYGIASQAKKFFKEKGINMSMAMFTGSRGESIVSIGVPTKEDPNEFDVIADFHGAEDTCEDEVVEIDGIVYGDLKWLYNESVALFDYNTRSLKESEKSLEFYQQKRKEWEDEQGEEYYGMYIDFIREDENNIIFAKKSIQKQKDRIDAVKHILSHQKDFSKAYVDILRKRCMKEGTFDIILGHKYDCDVKK